MKTSTIRYRGLAAACASLLAAGCGALQLQSTWRPQQPVQSSAEGTIGNRYLPFDVENTFACIENDRSDVYISLRTTNKEVALGIRRWGLTVWFDPEGGKKNKFGIHYPARPRWNEASSAQGTEGGSFTEAATEDVDLFEQGNDEPHRMTLASTGGIEASTRMQRDTLFCFLKVPLVDDAKHPFAIGALPGTAIGIGVESSPTQRVERTSEGSQREGGGEERGRRGRGFGRGGRRPGGEGRGNQGEGDSSGKSFEIWTRVQLAAPPSNVQ